MAVGRLFRYAALLVLLVVIFGGGWAVGRLGLLSTVPTASLADRERQFSERMQNASLVWLLHRLRPQQTRTR